MLRENPPYYSMICQTLDLGLIPYEDAWKLQDQFAAQITRGERPPTLLLLEHPHVYTFGRRGQAKNLLWNADELKRRGITVYYVDRGGDVTYHGPGQLVGYPLLPLGIPHPQPLSQGERGRGEGRIPEADYVGYVRKLEKMLIVAFARLGLAAGQRSGMTGIWVQADVASRCPRCRPEDREKPAKIAAIGVKVDTQGISRHGFALNVSPDMSYFDGIVPCGLTEPVISLADLLAPVPTMENVKAEVTAAFGEVFGYEMQKVI